jgi:dephospho-CoA kinase
MTMDRLAEIRSRQMADRDKRRQADFVVQTGLGRRHTLQRLRHIVRVMARRGGRKWPPKAFDRMTGEPRHA